MTSRIEDIKVGEPDSRGIRVKNIRTGVSGRFVVYVTERDVRIQFADNDDMGVNQRAALREVLALHSKIEAMLEPFQESTKPYLMQKLREYNAKIAGALYTSLKGDVAGGLADLMTVKAEVAEELASDVRCRHVLYAAAATFALLVIARILHTQTFKSLFGAFAEGISPNFWNAAAVGAIGALFSIALDFRKRKVEIDHQPWDNAVDAVMRIFVGSVSAVLLIALLQSNLFNFSINNASINSTDNINLLIVAAFAAGFTERLVADIFSSVAIGQRRAVTTQAAAGANERWVTGELSPQPATDGKAPKPEVNKQLPQPEVKLPVADGEMPLKPYGEGLQTFTYEYSEEALEPDEDQTEADGETRPTKTLPPGNLRPVG